MGLDAEPYYSFHQHKGDFKMPQEDSREFSQCRGIPKWHKANMAIPMPPALEPISPSAGYVLGA